MPPTEPSVAYLREWLDRKLARRRLALESAEREEASLIAAKKKEEVTLSAQAVIQQIAQAVQNKAHRQISKIVSRCLSSVFGGEYELRIEFEQKRGKTEAEFVYYKDGHRVNPRVTSGGVLEVASLALRLCSLSMTLPQPEKLLCLDEPFAGLSKPNLRKMAALIETLGVELSVQFLIATHSEELQIGEVIRVGD